MEDLLPCLLIILAIALAFVFLLGAVRTRSRKGKVIGGNPFTKKEGGLVTVLGNLPNAQQVYDDPDKKTGGGDVITVQGHNFGDVLSKWLSCKPIKRYALVSADKKNTKIAFGNYVNLMPMIDTSEGIQATDIPDFKLGASEEVCEERSLAHKELWIALKLF